MNIYLATDHAGFELKEELKVFLEASLGHQVEDCGARELDTDDDYPPYIATAARKVAMDARQGVESRAVILGASGQGEGIMANRFPGVRATVYYGGDIQVLKNSRQDNDANILSLGAAFISLEEAKRAVHAWLETPFSGEERHQRRIQQIESEASA